MDSSEQSIPNFTTTALLISKDCARPMDTKNGGRSSHCGSAEEGLIIEVVIAVFFSPQNVQFTRNCCQICNRTILPWTIIIVWTIHFMEENLLHS